MKIALVGYGKMGRTIEKLAVERGHEIGLRISHENKQDLTSENLSKCDVAIEFSTPESAVENIEKCIEAGIPVAVGTTGWYDQYVSICGKVENKGSALLAATNFSIGVNIFFELNRNLAKLMANRPEYKAQLEEIHHTQKLDSPSGTAISLAEDLIVEHPHYSKWINEFGEEEDTLAIISKREPEVPGTHSICFRSEIDEIEIKHTAKSREGFALGSLLAAEFLLNKKGVFSMKDLLKIEL